QSDETGDAQKTEDIPAAGPVEEKPEVTTSKAEKAESESQEKAAPVEKASQPIIAQASTEQPDETSTPREPVTRKAVLAPGAVRAIERPEHSTAKKPEAQPAPRTARAKATEETKMSEPAKPAPSQAIAAAKSTPSQPAEAETKIEEDVPAEGPATETKKEVAAVSPPAARARGTTKVEASAKETPVDDSIRALTGPPSTLRSNP